MDYTQLLTDILGLLTQMLENTDNQALQDIISNLSNISIDLQNINSTLTTILYSIWFLFILDRFVISFVKSIFNTIS